jgi:hypothetical protein
MCCVVYSFFLLYDDVMSPSDLQAGTGRLHPRRAVDRAGTGTTDRWVRRARLDGFFFFKTVPYPSHTRARRGYTGTTGTDTGVLGHG